MPQAISYARFSSTTQLGNSSEQRQLESYQRWLALHPEYTDSHLSTVDQAKSAYGTSTKTAKHKKAGLGRILEAIEQRRISPGDCIVVESFDRISREDTSTALDLINGILSAGVNIVTLEDNQMYSRSSLNTAAVYVLITKIQASHEYSKRLSTRIKAAWSSKVKKLAAGADDVKAANRPIWIDAENQIIEDVATMVREAIQMYKAGDGYRAIIIHLSEKYPNIAPKHEKSIKRWFNNESLAGYWKGFKAYPGLVSLDEFMEIKALAQSRARYGRPEDQYLLSGLIKCSSCDATYHFRRQRPKPTIDAPEGSIEYLNKPDIVYANCSAYLKRGRCSNSFTLPYEFAEFVFESVAGGLLVAIAEAKAYDILSSRQYSGLIERKQLLQENYEAAYKFYMKVKDDRALEEAHGYKTQLDEVIALIEKQEKALARRRQERDKQVFTMEDFLYGTPEQQALHNETQRIIYELEANPVAFNVALKEVDFKIIAGRSADADCLGEITTTENYNRYKLIRRSQKLAGYIVKGLLVDEDSGLITEQEYLVKRKPKQ